MVDYTDELIRVIREDATPALGCTEPVAVAYAAAVAGDYTKGPLRAMRVAVSKNIYKNGKSVLIPHTGECGLDLAAAVGYTGGDAAQGFLVLTTLDSERLAEAKSLLEQGKVRLAFVADTPDVYVSIEADADNEVRVLVQDGHTNLMQVQVDGDIVYEAEAGQTRVAGSRAFLRELSFQRLREITEQVPAEKIEFIEEGIDMNLEAAQKGLEDRVGLGMGAKLQRMQEEGRVAMDAAMQSRILTAAAADMRMGGGDSPIMTSGGSGNQGLGVILPVYIVAKEHGCTREQTLRAVFFAHAVNEYVKSYSGKLSGMCGCAIGAGIGAAAAITWLYGGDDTQIAGACNNMFANISGILCDGAKDTCSMKLSTSAGEAVLSAHLALEGMVVQPSVGVIGATIEETIQNIGRLSHQGFSGVDDVMLDIIDQYGSPGA